MHPSRDGGKGCTHWMQKPWLTIFHVAAIAALAAPGQILVPSRQNQNTICSLPFLIFVFTTLLASPFLAVDTQTDWFIIKQATASVGANLAFCTCSVASFQNHNQLSSGDRAAWGWSSIQ